MYAVVRLRPGNQMSFSILHDDLDSAKKEAERLAGKEKDVFLILKAIFEVQQKANPVQFATLE